MKILVLSLADETFSDIGSISSPNKRRYAVAHGYEFVCADQLLDTSRSASWNKVLWIDQYLRKYDWLFWTDADSLVMNGSIWLENIIGEDEHDFIIGKDENGPNAGQFLIRNCRWSRGFLGTIWDQTEYVNHAWSEQAALMHVLREMPESTRTEHVSFLPSKNTLNAYVNHWRSDYQPGDFIIHFVGMGQCHEQLKKLMVEWKDKAF